MFDPRVYLVTDPDLVPPSRLPSAVREAVRGGVTLVQLRDKQADGRRLVEVARSLRTVLAPFGVPLLINDRVDIALAADADGVHLGQSDLPVADARRLLGPDRIVGLSVEAVEQAEAAEVEHASYVAVSPVFGTPTKTNTAAPLGLEGVVAVRARCSRPVVGIGGIDADRAQAVIRAGADGVAVVSAILGAVDIATAAHALRRAVDGALEKGS